MKLKNLTIEKIKEICKSKKGCPKTCPLKDHRWYCAGLRNMTTKELESEIVITPKPRKYYVKFTKCNVFLVDNDGKKKVFQDNCGFCVSDLHSYSIKRPFDNERIIVEYIQKQLEEDYEHDQMTMSEYIDPFTGIKNK